MPSNGYPGASMRPHGASLSDANRGTGSTPVPPDKPELRILADLVARSRDSLATADVLRSVLITMAESLDSSSALLVLTAGHGGDMLDPVATIGRFERLGAGCLDSVESFVGFGVRGDGLVRSGELSRDERASDDERSLGAGPACARALRAGTGVVGGVAFARDRGAAPFTDEDLSKIAAFDSVIAVLLDRLGLALPGDGDPPSASERRLMNTLRHEVNNPLAVVMGQAQILRNDPGLEADPHLRQSIEAIYEGSARIRDVLRALTSAGEESRRARDSDRLDPPFGGA